MFNLLKTSQHPFHMKRLLEAGLVRPARSNMLLLISQGHNKKGKVTLT